MPTPCIYGKQADMFNIHRSVTLQKHRKRCFLDCVWRGKHDGIFAPLATAYVNIGVTYSKTFFLRIKVTQTNVQLRLSISWNSRPYRKPILFTAKKRHSKESPILNPCGHIALAAIRQSHIMGTAAERAVIPHFNTTYGVPSHKRLRKFKRPVLYQFAIKSTVGAIIDVFKKDSVHCRGYFRPTFIGVDFQHDALCFRLDKTSGKAKCIKQF